MDVCLAICFLIQWTRFSVLQKLISEYLACELVIGYTNQKITLNTMCAKVSE